MQCKVIDENSERKVRKEKIHEKNRVKYGERKLEDALRKWQAPEKNIK